MRPPLENQRVKRRKNILILVKLSDNLNFKDILKQIQSTSITHNQLFLLFKLNYQKDLISINILYTIININRLGQSHNFELKSRKTTIR